MTEAWFSLCCLATPYLSLLCSRPLHTHLPSLTLRTARERQCWSPLAAPLPHHTPTAVFGPTDSRPLWNSNHFFGGLTSETIHNLDPGVVFQPRSSLRACDGIVGMADDDPLPSSMTDMI